MLFLVLERTAARAGPAAPLVLLGLPWLLFMQLFFPLLFLFLFPYASFLLLLFLLLLHPFLLLLFLPHPNLKLRIPNVCFRGLKYSFLSQQAYKTTPIATVKDLLSTFYIMALIG